MNILSWFISSWPRMGADEPVDLESWRIWLVKIAVILGVILLPLGMITSFPVFMADGNFVMIAFDCLVWFILLSRLFSKADSFKANAYIIFVLLYIEMTFNFIELGPTHARSAWLVWCAVISALMFGMRGAIASTFLNIVILIVLYSAVGPDNKAWAAEYSAPYSKWLMFIVNASLVTLGASLPVSFMLSRLGRSLKHEREVQKKLSEESEKLRAANINLEKEIEHHRQTEETLRESEERLNLLFENAPDAYFLVDLEGRFLNGNKISEAIFGYKREDLIGKTAHEANLFTSVQSQRAAALFGKTIQGLSCGPEELVLTHKTGSEVTLEINAYPIKIKNEIQILAIARDITERKQSEKEKKQLEDKLNRAQKMEAIGTLAGGIAHDFNNILTAIIGFTEMALQDAGKGTTLERNLHAVRKAGYRAKDLVKRILTFSRYTEQELRPVQVNSIVNEVMKLIRATMPSTIEIKQNIESDSAIMADPVQVHQVLMNLCTNAGHAMMKYGGILEVSLTDVQLDTAFLKEYPEMNPGHHIKLTVSDTGHGIFPEIIDRIFDPYFTTKAHGEGTGLGLSVVHGIVKSYKGGIAVMSKPGKGTTVDIFLPVIAVDPVLDEGSDEPLPTGRGRILFVDDEPSLDELGMHMLESLGYEVVAKTSSVEAFELFRAQPERFDLVITDMTMPVMTGEALAVEILKVRADIPIILCTGFSHQINKKKAIQLGIKAFIMKPFVLREIGLAVREAMGKV
jgi:two-component system cell cycle sensor histidine kinase/response regulator CckA